MCYFKPAETGVQSYNSFDKKQKIGEKNENFRLKWTIFNIISYFYISEYKCRVTQIRKH